MAFQFRFVAGLLIVANVILYLAPFLWNSKLFLTAVCFVLVLALYAELVPDRKQLNGKYSFPGKWYYLKFGFMFIILTLRKRGVLKSKGAGYGSKSRDSGALIDIPQPLSAHELAVDATYFNGFDSHGFYLGTGIQRRQKGKVETLLFMRVPGIGILQWPFHPSTAAMTDDPDGYSTNGLRYESVVPMKQWKVSFDGTLKQKPTAASSPSKDGDKKIGEIENKQLKVKFDFDWTAHTDYFDFDTDMSCYAVARAMAREPWSRELFQKLDQAHQTHTEQFGTLKGTLAIEGYAPRQLELVSMHDHSYGDYRDWGDFNRYMIHYFAAEDGTRISFLMISLKETLTQLITGFVFDPAGRKHSITGSDKNLWEMGEDGVPLSTWSLRLETSPTGKKYNLKIDVVDGTRVYCGWDWEAQINTKFCKVEVNGVRGQGMVEWEYRHQGGLGNDS